MTYDLHYAAEPVARPNDEEREDVAVPKRPLLPRSSSSVSFAFGHLTMLAYRVTINGKHIATVGMKEDGLLFLKASWMRLKNAGEISFPNEGDAQFTISGLRDKTDEHLDWYSKGLTPGDKIVLELVQTDIVDAPKKVERKPKS